MSRRWAFAFVVAAVMWVAGDVDTEARKAPRIVAPRPEVVARTYRDDLRWMASNRDRVFWLGGRVAVDSFVKINRRTELFEWGP